ncbi:T9SS type B sorting domain-containing protein [Maribacter aquivivus]|uniref:T9SS type B sorting domain-containing protein n=1 Tax=Maribacter aquivivus TaxID=228958 RepID=UPI0024908483|nr:T9SS type B sorting domain-containing protein [Maribacter aquivivus]
MNRNIFLFFFLIPLLALSQGEADNWYFGFGAGLSFNVDGTVNSVDESAIYSHEGSASISNTSGELLFYTDGVIVYNRNHQVMANGNGLFGNTSSTQSAIIVPYPENDNLYLIFTVDATEENVRGSGLNYSVVDITLDNGNGAVTLKNINLLNNCAEKLTAVVKECDKNTVWILTFATETGMPEQKPFFDTFHAFEINSTGVSTNSIKSTFGGLSIDDDRGYLRLSPNGLKLANANASSGLYLYDFDTQSGIVSNQQEVLINSTNSDSYGVEFSPNSQYLYVTASNNLFSFNGQKSSLLQYDLADPDVNASQVILDDRSIFRSALQLGPNGKIYRPITVNYEIGTKYLGVVNNPNEKGLASNYVHNQVELISGTTSQGLPPFIVSNFNEVNFKEIENTNENLTICEGNPILLQSQLFAGASYEWEKDGLVFMNDIPNITSIPISTQEDSGNYQVTIIRPGYADCPIIGEIRVDVVPPPIAVEILGGFCDVYDENSTDGIMTIDLNEFSVNPDFTYYYYDSFENLEVDKSISITDDFINNTPFEQRLWYKIVNEANCEATGELVLNIHGLPNLVLEDVYDFCINDENVEIIAPSGFDSFNWYLEENESQILISTGQKFNPEQEGNYVLEGVIFTGGFESDDFCSVTTSFSVVYYELAEIVDVIIEDNTINNQIEIIVEGDGNYEYSVDGINFQEGNVFENLSPGNIVVYVNEKNGCGEITQEIEIEALTSMGQFPSFFTPNGDGINDYWNYIPPDLNNDISIIHIFNRYGKLLYQISPFDEGWDGTFKGQLQHEDDYWYQALDYESKVITGHFSLKY